MRYWWASLLCVAMSGITQAANTPSDTNYVQCAAPQLTKTSFSVTCNAVHQTGKLKFILSGKSSDHSDAILDKIQIFRDDKLLQVINVTDEEAPNVSGIPANVLTLRDYNFDGYDDLVMYTSTAAHGAEEGIYWLYSPQTGHFEHSKELDNYDMDMELDTKSKTISMSGMNSCCSSFSSTSHWVGGHLRVLESSDSGDTQMSQYLRNVPSLRAFVKDKGDFCGTETTHYNDAEKITKIVISTDGGPCGDDNDYAKSKWRDKSRDGKRLNGTYHHKNITDIYKAGLLQSRTIIFNPPRAQKNAGIVHDDPTSTDEQ